MNVAKSVISVLVVIALIVFVSSVIGWVAYTLTLAVEVVLIVGLAWVVWRFAHRH